MCEITPCYPSSDTKWIADSGESMHMPYRRDIFDVLQPASNDQTVRIADDNILPVAGRDDPSV